MPYPPPNRERSTSIDEWRIHERMNVSLEENLARSSFNTVQIYGATAFGAWTSSRPARGAPIAGGILAIAGSAVGGTSGDAIARELDRRPFLYCGGHP